MSFRNSINSSVRSSSVTTVHYEEVKPGSSDSQIKCSKNVVQQHTESDKKANRLSGNATTPPISNTDKKLNRSFNLNLTGNCSKAAAAIRKFAIRVFNKIVGGQKITIETIPPKPAVIEGLKISDKTRLRAIQGEARAYVRQSNGEEVPMEKWPLRSVVQNYKNYIGVQLQLARPGTSYSTETLKTLIYTRKEDNPEMRKALLALVDEVSVADKLEGAEFDFDRLKTAPQEEQLELYTQYKEKLGGILDVKDPKNCSLDDLSNALEEKDFSVIGVVFFENALQVLNLSKVLTEPLAEKPDNSFFRSANQGYVPIIDKMLLDERGVDAFLSSKGYDHQTADLFKEVIAGNVSASEWQEAIQKNLTILDQCEIGDRSNDGIDQKAHPFFHEFNQETERLAREFYQIIEGPLDKFKEAARLALNLESKTEKGEQWSASELFEEYKKQSNEKKIEDPGEDMYSLLDRMAFLERSKSKDLNPKVGGSRLDYTPRGLLTNVLPRKRVDENNALRFYEESKHSKADS